MVLLLKINSIPLYFLPHLDSVCVCLQRISEQDVYTLKSTFVFRDTHCV